MAKVKDQLKELRGLKEADLQRRLSELREKLRELSFRTRADEVKNVHQGRQVKQEIARILTLLNQSPTIKRR